MNAPDPLPTLDPRIPRWPANSLLPRACPLCARKGAPHCVRPDGLAVERCSGCDFYYVSPAPNHAELALFYAQYASRHHRRAPTRAELDRADPLRDVRLQELRTICEFQAAEVLDVGCGHGAFLYALGRLGARAQGVDLDAAAVAHARNHLGVDAQLGAIDDAPQRNYDLIFLNDVLEHPLDPATLFSSCVSKLADGGHLAIWTPNADSRFPGQIQFRVDLEHMQYFTVQSIAKLAAQHALGILHIETLGEPAIASFEPRPSTTSAVATRAVKRITARVATSFLRARRTALFCGSPERNGDYALFAILRKALR